MASGGGGGSNWRWRLPMAAAVAAAVPAGGGGIGGHSVRAAPSCLLVDVLLVEADSFPFAGGGIIKACIRFKARRHHPTKLEVT
ncbi:hypothetical protein OsJ_28536 [Oryza sativa Japonica Group]|uniref:Uncharacterized protein n=1 Tax=Oryza sativa subsp. japonica TaxID=39947 RepID=B9G2C5_ORYSJ|nr:hypothetical protein OsJ_28536 [Oryza sativa Japonica Group]